MEDPLAGAEANLLANFSFGRGVGIPVAKDPRVQAVIDEAWKDPVNRQKLTGFEAQRHRSNELLTQANLYPVAFVTGGRVRLGFLDADTVVAIVTDPDDEERPLYYVTRKRRIEWDFTAHRVKTTDELMTGGQPKVVYYAHWRNVDDAQEERIRNHEDPLEGPAKADLADGVVEHIRINRIGRTQFGTPPWARTLRFLSAMNQLSTAHVKMAQAASTIIAKRMVQGSPNEVTRAANNILAQTGEIAAARFGTGVPPADIAARIPPEAGSFWVENQAQRLEPVNLQSGAAQMVQTTQIVRAPIAAASGFGQHYLGDASSANLATATSLELPTLMTVQAWQETFEQLLRWFTDMVIQSAVRSGRLSRDTPNPELEPGEDPSDSLAASRALSELCYEDDQAEMERRVGFDLGYSFEMPYPGRRNLPDVVNLVTMVAAGYDPNGMNVPLRRALLQFLAVHGMELADPQGWVDEVLPEEAGTPEIPPEPQMIDPTTGQPVPGGTPPVAPGGGETPPNVLTGRPNPASGDMSEGLEAALAELDASVVDAFRRDVLEPLLSA
jgi:hypothetical protein